MDPATAPTPRASMTTDAPAPATPTPAPSASAPTAAVESPNMQPPAEPLVISDPEEMVTGESLPIEPHTFTSNRGRKITLLLQGLTYTVKSRLDAMQTLYWQEAARSGQFHPNMYSARLLAAAVRRKNGMPAYMSEKDQESFAIRIAGEWNDGELIRGGNKVLDLSGYGEQADAAVGKSSTTTPTSS